MALPGGDKFRILLLGLVLAVSWGFAAGSVRALDWPSEEELGSDSRLESVQAWSRIGHLFAVERLSAAAFARYASALEQGDCDHAVDILWHEFTALEPELARRGRNAAVARRWLASIPPVQFPEHAFCDASQGYAKTTASIQADGIDLGPETAALGWAERRNTDRLPSYQAYLIDTLQVLFNVANNDIPEAIRLILEEDRVGRYVQLTDEQRLSLLLRLARLGHAGRHERAEAAKLARQSPIGAVAAARAYAAREAQPQYHRWQAFQAQLEQLRARIGSGAAAAQPTR